MRRMTTWTVLLAALAAVSALAVGCGKDEGGEGAETITLTYANFPPASTFPCVQMERWAEEVAQRTDGRVKVVTHPGGTLLGAKGMFEGVKSGAADIGCTGMSYFPGRFPVIAAVDLPLGFRSAEEASLVLYDLVEKHQPAGLAEFKVVTLFTCPPASLLTSEKVAGVDDLKDMQIRASGTGVDVVKALGASPKGMPMSAVPEAIQKGTIEGIATSQEVLKDMNFAVFCPYSTTNDLGLHVVTFAVVMNRAKWDALPEDVKAVIDELSREQAQWTGKYVDDHTVEALAWAEAEKGHEQTTFSEAEVAKVRARVQPIIDAYKATTPTEGLTGADVLADIEAIRGEVAEELE